MKYILLIFISIFLMSCSSDNFRTFQFQYEVKIDSTNGKKLELWIPIPKTNEVQIISNLSYNMGGLDYQLKKEKSHDNNYLYLYSNTGTNRSTTVSIIFDVIRKEHSNEAYHSVNPDNYLGAYATVPIGNSFKAIINQNNLSNKDVEGIYDFVLSGMHYGKPKNIGDKYYNNPWLSEDEFYGMKEVSRDRVVELYQISKKTNNNYTFGNGNSIYACDIGVGNCTDYHSYFMSLARTLEVPVRFHMGFPIPLDNEGIINGYHCWADYFVKGEGWFPIDISEADKNENLKDYFFGTIDNNRVDMMVGRDFILDGYDNGSLNLFIYPILEIDDQVSSNFSKKFSYKNLK